MDKERLLELAGVEVEQLNEEAEVFAVIHTEPGGSYVGLFGIYNSKAAATKRGREVKKDYGEDIHVVPVPMNTDVRKRLA